MVSSPLRAVVVVFAVEVTVTVALPVPAVDDNVAHVGLPVSVHAPVVVMINVLVSPAAAKLSEGVDTVTVGVVGVGVSASLPA